MKGAWKPDHCASTAVPSDWADPKPVSSLPCHDSYRAQWSSHCPRCYQTTLCWGHYTGSIVRSLCHAGLVAAWCLQPWSWLAWLAKQQSQGVSSVHLNWMHLLSLSPCLFPYGAFNVYSTTTLPRESNTHWQYHSQLLHTRQLFVLATVPTPVTQCGRQKKMIRTVCCTSCGEVFGFHSVNLLYFSCFGDTWPFTLLWKRWLCCSARVFADGVAYLCCCLVPILLHAIWVSCDRGYSRLSDVGCYLQTDKGGSQIFEGSTCTVNSFAGVSWTLLKLSAWVLSCQQGELVETFLMKLVWRCGDVFCFERSCWRVGVHCSFEASASENRLGHCLVQNYKHGDLSESWAWKNQAQCLPTSSHVKTIQALHMQNTDTHKLQRLVCHLGKEVQNWMS